MIGCGVKLETNTKGTESNPVVFFTRNREEICRTRVKLPNGGVFPTVGLYSRGEKVDVHMTGKWKHPDEMEDEKLSHRPRKESDTGDISKRTLRMTESCLDYAKETQRLRYTSRPQRIQEDVGFFQDLSHPITNTSNYFEVELLDLGLRGEIAIGVAHNRYPKDRMPGVSSDSVAYRCDDGQVFKGLTNRSTFSPAEKGDRIGCGVRFSSGASARAKVFFTRKGVLFEDYETDIPKGGFYPTIGMLSAGEEVVIDFDAKWFPQESNETAAAAKFRSERVQVEGDIVKYTGTRFSGAGTYQHLDRPIGRDFPYFEVTMKDYGQEGRIGVGLAGRDCSLSSRPGCSEKSVAWYCNDGAMFIAGEKSPEYPHGPAKEGDVIGCGVDFEESQTLHESRQDGDQRFELVTFFTFNGTRFPQQPAHVTVPSGGLFPTVGLQSPGEVVKIDLSAIIAESTGTVNRTIAVARAERVRLEGDCISYVTNDFNEVGGVQLEWSTMRTVSYFEVTIISSGERGKIAIGVALEDYPLYCQPGWNEKSVAYHCYDKHIYDCGKKIITTQIEEGDVSSSRSVVIGCGIQRKGGKMLTVFFTRNDKEIGHREFNGHDASTLYPTVCLHSRGELVKINLHAQSPVRTEGGHFGRAERVYTRQNMAYYNPDRYGNVGAFQLSRKVSKYRKYFEVRVKDSVTDGAICVGLAKKDYPLDCLPGWLPGSIGYLCETGCLFEGSGIGDKKYQTVPKGETIGCGVDYSKSAKVKGNVVVFFTHNKKTVESFTCELELPDEGLFPTVGLRGPGSAIELIRGARPDPGHDNTGYVGETHDKRSESTEIDTLP